MEPTPLTETLRCACGTALRSGARFCGACGILVPSAQGPAHVALGPVNAQRCACGVEPKSGARYCGACGSPVALHAELSTPTFPVQARMSTASGPEHGRPLLFKTVPEPAQVVWPRAVAPGLDVAERARPLDIRKLVLAGGASALLLLTGWGGWYWISTQPMRDFSAALAQGRLIAGSESAYVAYLKAQTREGAGSKLMMEMGAKALPILETRTAAFLEAWVQRGEGSGMGWDEFILLTEWMQRIEPSPSHRAQHAFARGQAEMVRGNPRAALPPLQEACLADPRWALPQHALGEALLAQGDEGSARRCFERAHGLDQAWAAPALRLGVYAGKDQAAADEWTRREAEALEQARLAQLEKERVEAGARRKAEEEKERTLHAFDLFPGGNTKGYVGIGDSRLGGTLYMAPDRRFAIKPGSTVSPGAQGNAVSVTLVGGENNATVVLENGRVGGSGRPDGPSYSCEGTWHTTDGSHTGTYTLRVAFPTARVELRDENRRGIGVIAIVQKD